MCNIKDNNIAYIDLSNNRVQIETVSPWLRKYYIGGAGINTKILYDLADPKLDPLSEDNVLIFGCGIVVGTRLFSGNRCTVTAKSPLTNIFGDSNFGGSFASALRFCSYDHLVFTGKSSTPVYVYIEEGRNIKIVNGEDLWGSNSERLIEKLKKRHGDTCEIACIGRAGENKVLFSSISVSNNHSAGRTGMGCVMGSKGLKAIVVKAASSNVPIHNISNVNKQKNNFIKKYKESPACSVFSEHGTLLLVDLYNAYKALPNYNAQELQTDKIDNISTNTFIKEHQIGKAACLYCPVACVKKYKINKGKGSGKKGVKIDYGSVAALGPNLGVYNYNDILYFENLANDYGMDTIELGATISLAMESYQKNDIFKNHTNGLPLEWGNTESIEKLIKLIGENSKLGSILSKGSKRASEILGVKKYSYTIKDVSVPASTKDRKAWALQYITSTRGGDHLKCYPFSVMYGASSDEIYSKIFKTGKSHDLTSSENIGRVVWWHENYKYIIDSFGFCMFAIGSLALSGIPYFRDFSDIMKSVLNIEISDKNVFLVGERIFQLQKIFNSENNKGKIDDDWPTRATEDGYSKDVVDIMSVDRNEKGMLDEYYYYRGITIDGRQTKKRLDELEIEYKKNEGFIDETYSSAGLEELLQTVNINV